MCVLSSTFWPFQQLQSLLPSVMVRWNVLWTIYCLCLCQNLQEKGFGPRCRRRRQSRYSSVMFNKQTWDLQQIEVKGGQKPGIGPNRQIKGHRQDIPNQMSKVQGTQRGKTKLKTQAENPSRDMENTRRKVCDGTRWTGDQKQSTLT